MSVYEKLTNIQNELKAPKSQYNSFGKYNYRNCEDILSAVKPILKEYKVSLFITDNIELVGSRYYVRASVTLADQESDTQITVNALAREEEAKKGMDGSQVTGASSSYARKYALNGLFAIDDTKDIDTTNDGKNTEQAAKDEALKDAVSKLSNCNSVDELKLFKETLPEHVTKSKIFITEATKRYNQVNGQK